MKKNIRVYSIFFMFLFVTVNIFSAKENTNNGKTIDFVEKFRLEQIIDEKLKFFFSAIRNHNNKYVKMLLNTEENRQAIKKEN